MMLVALIMRTWIIQMRAIVDVHCYILADDVLILATGRAMISKTAEAINTTHKCLQTMGARIAPDKSYNFTNCKVAGKWLAEKWWEEIEDKIKVIKDVRYLGAHLTTTTRCTNGTLNKR